MGISSGPAVGFFPERLLSEKEKEMTSAITPQRSNPMNREELVEEIASLILIVARHADDETALAAEGAAMAIISRISQAIENGELELPGHQLYLKITPYLKGEQEKVLGVLREELRIGDILITARPIVREPETGKGE